VVYLLQCLLHRFSIYDRIHNIFDNYESIEYIIIQYLCLKVSHMYIKYYGSVKMNLFPDITLCRF